MPRCGLWTARHLHHSQAPQVQEELAQDVPHAAQPDNVLPAARPDDVLPTALPAPPQVQVGLSLCATVSAAGRMESLSGRSAGRRWCNELWHKCQQSLRN